MKKNVILLFIFTFTIVLTLSSFKVSASSYNVNLASPDLTDKEHLSNGVYRLYDNNGITIDYNVYNGIWTINGQSTGSAVSYTLFNVLENQEYTVTYKYVSGSISDYAELFYATPNIGVRALTSTNYQNERITTTAITTQNRYVLYSIKTNIFNNFQFKLQLEKGDTATVYKLPMASLRQHNDLISGDLPNNFFQVLYDLIKDFIRSIAFVWIWLNDPIKIGFDLPIIGYIGIPPFTPLSAFGIGILVVIGLWAVKSLVPMG